VGNIVGDGMQVTFSAPVQTVRICFVPSPNIPFKMDEYPVVDFATISADSSLVPLKVTEPTYADNQICAFINGVSGTQTYIPILRKDNYEDVPLRLYDLTSLILIYILGCLFCITASFALYKMMVVLYTKIKSGRRFRIAQLMIVFIFLFDGVRGVYFFLLPGGLNLKFIVSDYILVVLPTFFYFTAFTIIVSLWAVVCLQPMLKGNFSFDSIVRRLTLIINVILYLFFILICLLFQYLTKQNTAGCAGVATYTDTAIQTTLALVYAVVIAFLSFVVGIGFIIFGTKLFIELNVNNSKRLSKKTRLQKQTFIITLVCSIAFILHCIFIIILAALPKANIIFSFVGLVITEIAPSFILLAVSENLRDSSTSTSVGTGTDMNSITEEDGTEMGRNSFNTQSDLPDMPDLPGDD